MVEGWSEIKTNQAIFNKSCISDYGKLEISHEDDKIVCKSYDEKLLSKEFPWDRNSLSQADTVSIVPNFIDKMVSKSINKINNGKASKPSGL